MRVALAVFVGLAVFALYVAAVLVVADQLLGRHWLAQVAFFAVAGIAWAWPARRLMVWAAGRPRG